jgi:hypothetical protein
MSAEVVDVLDNPVAMQDVMLHHVVFAKVGVPDYTCSTIGDYSGEVSQLRAERFYAEGEEHFALALPQGYGYPNRATDTWGLLYMLMNHHPHSMVCGFNTLVCHRRASPVSYRLARRRELSRRSVFNVAGPQTWRDRLSNHRLPDARGGRSSQPVATSTAAAFRWTWPTRAAARCSPRTRPGASSFHDPSCTSRGRCR